jgi:hypothetical protein
MRAQRPKSRCPQSPQTRDPARVTAMAGQGLRAFSLPRFLFAKRKREEAVLAPQGLVGQRALSPDAVPKAVGSGLRPSPHVAMFHLWRSCTWYVNALFSASSRVATDRRSAAKAGSMRAQRPKSRCPQSPQTRDPARVTAMAGQGLRAFSLPRFLFAKRKWERAALAPQGLVGRGPYHLMRVPWQWVQPSASPSRDLGYWQAMRLELNWVRVFGFGA